MFDKLHIFVGFYFVNYFKEIFCTRFRSTFTHFLKKENPLQMNIEKPTTVTRLKCVGGEAIRGVRRKNSQLLSGYSESAEIDL